MNTVVTIDTEKTPYFANISCEHTLFINPNLDTMLLIEEMERRLTSRNVEFTLSPRLSFAGKPAEQHIMMLPDGCGNIVEFKSQPRERVFATDTP